VHPDSMSQSTRLYYVPAQKTVILSSCSNEPQSLLVSVGPKSLYNDYAADGMPIFPWYTSNSLPMQKLTYETIRDSLTRTEVFLAGTKDL
jgi:hypothetical protein